MRMCTVRQAPRRCARPASPWAIIIGLVALMTGWTPRVHAEAPPPSPAPAAESDAPDDSVDLLAPEHTLVGSFVSYAADDQEVTVLDENEEELIFAVDPGVLPTAGGTTVPFSALHVGDQLALTVIDVEDGTERVTAIDVTRAPAKGTSPAN